MSQSISLYKLLANHKLFNKTINFDLKRIKFVLRKLNHPEKKLKNVINFLSLLVDKESKSLKIDFEDEIIKGVRI